MIKKLPRYQQLSNWLTKPLGKALLESEQESLAIIWSYVLGDYLLMLGSPTQSVLIEGSQLKHAVIVTPDKLKSLKTESMLCAEYESLPVLANSVDAILLPHTLEFSADPHKILRRVSESLKPEGFLIILGFNPLSLWGIRSLFSFGKKAPWSGSFRRASQIKDWLRLLNFNFVEQRRAGYPVPFIHPKYYHKYPFIERFCKTCLPIFGGVYIIVAQKKVFAVTPLRSKWKKVRATIHNGFAEPARRGMQNEENR